MNALSVAQTAAMLTARANAHHNRDATLPHWQSAEHAVTLHKLASRLHRWAERRCNEDLTCPTCQGEGDVPRGARIDSSGKPYRVPCRACSGHGDILGRRTEKARKTIAEIAATYRLRPYWQTDPRGCPVYLMPEESVPTDLATLDAMTYDTERKAQNFPTVAKLQARWIDSHYNRGVAVCS